MRQGARDRVRRSHRQSHFLLNLRRQRQPADLNSPSQTGFEFRSRRATPTILGIVIAEEHADAVIQAVFAMEEANDAKEFRKRQERCLKRWKRLVVGLRIRQRLGVAYGDTDGANSAGMSADESRVRQERNQLAGRSAEKRRRDEHADDDLLIDGTTPEPDVPPPRKAPKLAPIKSEADLEQAYSVPEPLYTQDFAAKPAPTPPPPAPASTGRTLRHRPTPPAPAPAQAPTARLTRGAAASRPPPPLQSNTPLAPVMRQPNRVKQEEIDRILAQPAMPRGTSTSGRSLTLSHNTAPSQLADTPRTLRVRLGGAASSPAPASASRTTRASANKSAAPAPNSGLTVKLGAGKANKPSQAQVKKESGSEDEEGVEAGGVSDDSLEYDSDF